jgi:hypothetical protein
LILPDLHGTAAILNEGGNAFMLENSTELLSRHEELPEATWQQLVSMLRVRLLGPNHQAENGQQQ